LRILIGVHQFFPKYYTGTERYVLNLAKQLRKLGNYVKVLTYAFDEDQGMFHEGDSPNMLYKEYSYEGIPVISLKHKNRPHDLAFLFDFVDLDIYHEARILFEREHFDIYHCAHPLRIASSIKAARDSGTKVVFMVTDYFLMCPQGIMLRSNNTLCDGPLQGANCLKYCFSGISKELMQKRNIEAQQLIGYCDCLLSPSEFLIKLFNYTGFISADKFIISRHGFDYMNKKNYFDKKQAETITFGYIGTIQYHKGVHVMIEGFKKARHKNIRLKVWGGCYHEKDYQKSIEKIAKKDSRTELKGVYNHKDMEDILSNIDVVIVPSVWYENAPLTIMTSLAYGIPVVTSNIGGMSEMIQDGHNGLTFEVGDPSDLCKKIGTIAKNQGLIDSFKRNIQYPIRLEEEAFNTELVYRQLFSQKELP
jgi:glycosyltransferase involved in cell wall biosynthesis